MTNLALIGVGSWGRNYITTCKQMSDIRIKYLCAKTKKKLDTYPDSFIKTTNFKDLFSYPDVDGVIIATPNLSHHELSYEFLKRGFNVLVEKPMSENFRNSLKLCSIKQKTGAVFQVGHIYLFDPAYKKTKELVKSIGKIRYIDYEGTNNGPVRQGTSALWDIGSHAVSLCLDISQKNPKNISAWSASLLHAESNYHDLLYIRLGFEDGTCAYMKLSWLYPVKRRKLVIVGEKDSLMYDAEAKEKVILYKDMIGANISNNHTLNKTKILFPGYSTISPLESELNDFTAAIKAHRNITYSGLEFGIMTTKLLNLAEMSIKKNGKPISFNL